MRYPLPAMAAETRDDRKSGPPAKRREGLAVGRVLMPLAVVAGACLVPAVLSSSRFGWSHLWSWLVGGPAGAVAGMLAALAALVLLNAALRMMGKR